MTLLAGTRLGPYEVIALLGEGGMGEVYRARDTQLKRNVALKILPSRVATDLDQLARFQREAEILASLNHTNIAHLYGLAETPAADSSARPAVRALVMELIEGPTLAERIARGPLPLDETLVVARQIAEALESAHERGVIHRDLKPANIKLTADGVVKVLDFGLAKALEPVGTQSGQSVATITSPAMTRAGVIMGTAAYMSPEQARGRPLDARTDIWAFGCVVFEMLTGQSPFAGDTITDVLGAIVHKEPEWTKLAGNTPERLRRMMHRCLAKDAKQRLHNIADARFEIEDLLTARRSGVVESDLASHAPSAARITRRERAAWSLATLAIAALIVGAWLVTSGRWLPNTPEVTTLRISILHNEGGEVAMPVISPDGRRVAYSARGTDGRRMIWIRDLNQSAPRALAGTEGGNRVFWSPDSKQVGFVAESNVKRVPVDGGQVLEIVRNVRVGASWGPGDQILYAGVNGIRRVAGSGGTPVDAAALMGPDWEYMWPSFLPDGKHFLFTVKHWAGLTESGKQGIYVGSIDNPAEIRLVLPELSNAVYAAPGFIVFARERQVMAVPFDPSAARVTGEAVALGETVAVDSVSNTGAFSAAANGTLATRPPPAPAMATATGISGNIESELTFLNRDGTVASRFGGVMEMTYFTGLSPDARAAVVQLTDPRTSATDLWRIDAATGARSVLTSMRTTGGFTGSPVFSPDGTRLAYGCQTPGMLDDICVRDLRTGVVTTLVEAPKTWEHPRDWSSDGQYLLLEFNPYDGPSEHEIRVWSAKTGAVTPYIKPGGVGVFSPDSTLVAYTSLETGRAEVYVTTFPERRQTWPLTTDGGTILSWRADGKEILVATLSGHIVAYPVTTTDGNFSTGTSQILIKNVGFDVRFARATRDHSKVLIRVAKDAEKDKGEIKLLFGWTKSLFGRTSP